MTHRLNDAKKYLQKAGNTRDTRYVDDVIKAMEGKVQWKIENKRVIIL